MVKLCTCSYRVVIGDGIYICVLNIIIYDKTNWVCQSFFRHTQFCFVILRDSVCRVFLFVALR